MRLVETTTIPSFDLPFAEFAAHLRLGSGFSDDDLQQPLLESCLRAAISAIEGRTGKVLIVRTFRWRVEDWRRPDVQALPLAPVTGVTGIKLITRRGDEAIVDPAFYVLVEDDQRPLLRAAQAMLPTIPTNGCAEVSFTAGFAASWAALPADLAQAVLLLAAHYYEFRNEGAFESGNMPFGVTSLIGRYRTVRILGGAA